MLGLDFARCQGHDPRLVGLTVQTERRQLGIIGVRCNHHDPLLAVIRLAHDPQLRRAHDPAITSTNVQLTCDQRVGIAREVHIAQAINAPFKGLAVVGKHDKRVDKTSQPAAFDLEREDQGFVAAQVNGRVQYQATAFKANSRALAIRCKTVLIVVLRRVKQVVGKPRFVGDPAQDGQY